LGSEYIIGENQYNAMHRRDAGPCFSTKEIKKPSPLRNPPSTSNNPLCNKENLQMNVFGTIP